MSSTSYFFINYLSVQSFETGKLIACLINLFPGRLIVSGQRSTQCYKVTGLSNDSISAYHKKEIVRGPYQVVWPLPTNVNKDSIYAEFL